jgi:uncharacterized protein
MAERALLFKCHSEQLLGILHVPDRDAKSVGMVVVVGGPQTRVGSHRQFTLMARAFANAGYPVLRFDYRGMGDSDGEVRTFESVDDDIRAAIDAMMQEVADLKGVVLWGLCDAASACMMYGNQNDARVHGLILANPWVRTEAGEASAYLKHYYLQRLWQKSFWKKVLTGGVNPFGSLTDLARKFFQSRQRTTGQISAEHYIDRMLRGWQAQRIPTLLLLSQRDLTAQEFVQHVSGDSNWQNLIESGCAKRIALETADHTFSARGDLIAATDACLGWMHQVPSTGSL